jgi:hypothetical protein
MGPFGGAPLASRTSPGGSGTGTSDVLSAHTSAEPSGRNARQPGGAPYHSSGAAGSGTWVRRSAMARR